MVSEKTIRESSKLILSQQHDLVLFSNPVGKAHQGEWLGLEQGILRLRYAGTVDYGLFKGSPDDVGWKSIVIQPHHVGTRMAIFVGLEWKKPGAYRRPEQKRFVARLEQDGAIAGFVDNLEDAIKLAHKYD